MTKMPTREERIEAMTMRHREYVDKVKHSSLPPIGFVFWFG